VLPLELLEDRPVGLPEDVRQHIDTTPVRHGDGDLARAGFGRPLDGDVEQGDEGVGSFYREPLVPGEGAAEIPLESIDLGEAFENRLLLVGVQGAR
jgi:hypothetical protein